MMVVLPEAAEVIQRNHLKIRPCQSSGKLLTPISGWHVMHFVIIPSTAERELRRLRDVAVSHRRRARF
jgi:hypothetical protein